MSTTILIAGTGKMGKSIGLYLLTRGNNVLWYSRSAERCESFEKNIGKHVRRLSSAGYQIAKPFFLSPESDCNSKVDVLIESIEEDISEKRKLLCTLIEASRPALVFSNSSSFLPEELHLGCTGLHFFNPVQITSLAELIFPKNCLSAKREEIITFVVENGLDFIPETDENAFAANRLLIPVQAEAVVLLREGVDPELLDIASCSPLIAQGQITLFKSIGVELICKSVLNYRKRAGKKEAVGLDIIQDGLMQCELERSGKCPTVPYSVEQLSRRFLYLLVNTCLHFRARGLLQQSQCNLILERVMGAECTVEKIVQREKASIISKTLQTWYKQTGRGYFQPCGLLC